MQRVLPRTRRFRHDPRRDRSHHAATPAPRYDPAMPLSRLEHPGDFIDGSFQQIGAAETELVIASPADLDDITAIHSVSAGSVDAAVTAARRAFPSWRRLSLLERAEYLRRYQAQLRAHREQLALTIAREVGKPL
jgi:hypothetical protein